MTELANIVVITILVCALLAAILVNTNDRPQRPSAGDEIAPGLDLGEADRVRGIEDRSALLPLGWVLLTLGVIGSIYTWTVDVAPYGDLANIDAVGQRSMLHADALATLVLGAVLACTGHVINEIRRGR